MNAISWMAPTQAQVQAADESVDVIVTSLQSDQGVHPETAVAAAARIAGTFLFRSFKLPRIDAKPGAAVLSDAANERGPLLVQTLGAGVRALNVTLQSGELNKEIPDRHKPQLSITATQELLESSLRAIASKYRLTDEQAAHSCALTAARLIQMSSNVLDPHIAFSLATYGLIEGAKTMPAPLRLNGMTKKPWYKVW